MLENLTTNPITSRLLKYIHKLRSWGEKCGATHGVYPLISVFPALWFLIKKLKKKNIYVKRLWFPQPQKTYYTALLTGLRYVLSLSTEWKTLNIFKA